MLSVRPSERHSSISSLFPGDNPSDVRVVLFCGDPTDCPTSDSIRNSIRNSNSYTNNKHSVNIRGSPSSSPCVVPANVRSRKPSEYPAADRAAKCDEGSGDEPYVHHTAVPSGCPASKAKSNSFVQSIQLLYTTPTVMPSMFNLIVPTSIQSPISLMNDKSGWFLSPRMSRSGCASLNPLGDSFADKSRAQAPRIGLDPG